ncbi:MAG: hypothetical protein K2P45_01220 [Eubacterium sp.]|nr:hypothetical protein [Eubacterium sp.]
MYDYRIIGQVVRKPKAMSGVLKKMMVFFAVVFLLLGIMISQGFMLPGFLLVVLYFFYSVLSQREYEYVLEGQTLTIDVILGKRYRRTAHILELNTMEATAPSRHEAVARYRKDTGTIQLPKYDYTSYEEDTPFYTMIVMENRQKIKLLLDLSEEMLQALKRSYPDKVFLS